MMEDHAIHRNSYTQKILDLLPDPPLKLGLVIAIQLAALDVRSTLDIGLCQHAEDAEQNTSHPLYRRPPLRGGLVSHRVVAGRVQDGDTDSAIGVDVWVKQGWIKGHCEGIEGIIGWKDQLRGEYTSFVRSPFWALYQRFPFEHVVLRDWSSGDRILKGVGGEVAVLFH